MRGYSTKRAHHTNYIWDMCYSTINSEDECVQISVELRLVEGAEQDIYWCPHIALTGNLFPKLALTFIGKQNFGSFRVLYVILS